jgi:hypothetical protein
MKAEPEPSDSVYVWKDATGRPLPFQDHQTILDFLSTARVVSRTSIARGVAKAEKTVLEKDGLRVRAAFRTVDENRRTRRHRTAPGRPISFRDAAVFECAAYELSELLQLHRVPPTVARRIGGAQGTLQIWVEDTMVEVERRKKGLSPPEPIRWARQTQLRYVFDSLLANVDRNQGNMLIDEHWNLWLIDHTRAFQRTTSLVESDKIYACEKNFLTALQEVGDLAIRERLEPYLTGREIDDLLKRRAKLVKHIERLIQKLGETKVLFELSPP